ncbi:MAG TPA: hypothetical protein VNR40_22480, partial [Steroidobacter sp.]|nr:hypothetical protein [Steroidobacter sp.]
ATYFAIGDVSFASVRQAATALSAAESHRLDIIDHLTVERAVALTEMRGAADDLLRFRSASKREAFAAAQIRQLREVHSHG